MSLFTVVEKKIHYTDASIIDSGYTDRMNAAYNWIAKVYDVFRVIFFMDA